MTGAKIRSEVLQRLGSRDEKSVEEFIRLSDPEFNKTIREVRELEMTIGRLEFEGKDSVKERRALVNLKKKIATTEKPSISKGELERAVRAEILSRSGLPDVAIKSMPELLKIYANLTIYAEKFPNTKRANIVLRGNTGTGKTYALVFLGHELIERGVFPLYVTAFSMVERFKRAVFERDSRAFDELLEAEVLLIDDIGVEPRIPNITDENIYHIINERLIAKRPFIISTNLTAEELVERYGERIAGRILAKDTSAIIKFEGIDMRLG